MKFVRFLGTALIFVISFVLLAFFIFSLLTPETESSWIIGLLALVFFGLGMSVRGKTKQKIKKEKHEQEHEQKLRERGIIVSSDLHHIEGLPLSEKTLCSVNVTPDSLIIEGGGTSFELKISQIRAAEVKTDAEIANIVHSSAVKGVAGGLLFGPIGLVVGARATNKKQTTYTYYLIINFVKSDGELTALMFDGGNSVIDVQKICDGLRPALMNNPKSIVQL